MSAGQPSPARGAKAVSDTRGAPGEEPPTPAPLSSTQVAKPAGLWHLTLYECFLTGSSRPQTFGKKN